MLKKAEPTIVTIPYRDLQALCRSLFEPNSGPSLVQAPIIMLALAVSSPLSLAGHFDREPWAIFITHTAATFHCAFV